MDDAAQNTLLALVVVIAVAFVVQAIALLVLVLAFRKWASRMATLAENTTRNAEPVLQAVRELVSNTKENLNLVSQNLAEISDLTKNQVTRFDKLFAELSDSLRLQMIRVDQLLSTTMARVEETTETIQQNILAPVREISALLAGVRTALDYLRHRNRRRGERATQEEELFI